MQISKSDFDAWWDGPVGREFRQMMKEDLDKLAYGTMTNSSARDHIGNAIEVGRFMAIMHYYNMSYETLTGATNEPNRNQAGRV